MRDNRQRRIETAAMDRQFRAIARFCQDDRWSEGDAWRLPRGWSWSDLRRWRETWSLAGTAIVPLATCGGVVGAGTFTPGDVRW